MSQDYITINPDTREITIPPSEVVFGVYQDKDVERKYFRCPRIVGDDIDLSECYIFINYVTADGKPGKYHCDDVKVEGDDIIFSWLLSSNVFDYNKKSKIKFAVQAAKADIDGKLINVFGTKPATGNTFGTIEATEYISDEYADIIVELLAKYNSVIRGNFVLESVTVDNRTGVKISVTNPDKSTYEEVLLDGLDGLSGKTPIKGEDYFTEADKQELVNAVMAALPSSEGVKY